MTSTTTTAYAGYNCGHVVTGRADNLCVCGLTFTGKPTVCHEHAKFRINFKYSKMTAYTGEELKLFPQIACECELATGSYDPSTGEHVGWVPMDEETRNNTEWTSSNKKVATVDDYGTLKTKKAGKTVITASHAGHTAKFTLTVKKAGLYNGKKLVNNKEVVIYSDSKKAKTTKIRLYGSWTQRARMKNKKIATFKKRYTNVVMKSNAECAYSGRYFEHGISNAQYTITAKKAGTTTFTITDDNGKKYTCKVVVKPNKRQRKWCKQGKHTCTKGNKCDWCGTKVK